MKFFDSKLGLILSLSYLVIFLLSGIWAIYWLIFDTANSMFSGCYAVLITFPWSYILLPLENSLGIIAWYEKFAGTPALYGFFGMLALLPSALLNATIFYSIGKFFDKTVGKKTQ